jgi:hypothetical protein
MAGVRLNKSGQLQSPLSRIWLGKPPQHLRIPRELIVRTPLPSLLPSNKSAQVGHM